MRHMTTIIKAKEDLSCSNRHFVGSDPTADSRYKRTFGGHAKGC